MKKKEKNQPKIENGVCNINFLDYSKLMQTICFKIPLFGQMYVCIECFAI